MNYNRDVAQLLKACLHDFGRDDLVTDGLDNHSTITIDVEKRPSINITTDEDNSVMLWATMVGYDSNSMQYSDSKDGNVIGNLAQVSEKLLTCQLDASYEQFGIGQPALCKGKDHIELCAVLQPGCFESKENFGTALEHFFNYLVEIDDILNSN